MSAFGFIYLRVVCIEANMLSFSDLWLIESVLIYVGYKRLHAY